MGKQHEVLLTQIRGQLEGAKADLEVAERALVEATERRDRFAASVEELSAILRVHEAARLTDE
jgi:hypothetical protein